jgi:DNA-directed RNA polymerase specialized sigma24 family protein
MTMFKTNQVANMKNAEYAVVADFCRIFDRDMNSLYLLSLLLTGDHEKAEQCFVEGLENAVSRNRVFKEWARSWARRVIIQNALRIISPRPNGANGSWGPVLIEGSDKTASERIEIAAVLGLEAFDRFVFVMSVLEGYSDHDCSILLGSARKNVLAARSRALQQIGSVVEFFRKQHVSTGSEEPVVHDRHSRVLEAVA